MAIIMRRCRMATYGPSFIQRGFGNGAAFDDAGVGEYLADFDLEANEGRGKLTLTSDPLKAKRFVAANEVILFMQQIPACRRRREDGRPNRPLTDFGWEVEVQLEQSLIDNGHERGASACSPVVPPRLPRRTRRARPSTHLPIVRQGESEDAAMIVASEVPNLTVQAGS
jgi:hypothetical protein